MSETNLIQLATSGGPAVVTLLLGVVLLRKDLKYLKEGLAGLRDDHNRCQQKREENENELHSRVTALVEQTSHLKGRVNGHGGG